MKQSRIASMARIQFLAVSVIHFLVLQAPTPAWIAFSTFFPHACIIATEVGSSKFHEVTS